MLLRWKQMLETKRSDGEQLKLYMLNQPILKWAAALHIQIYTSSEDLIPIILSAW